MTRTAGAAAWHKSDIQRQPLSQDLRDTLGWNVKPVEAHREEFRHLLDRDHQLVTVAVGLETIPETLEDARLVESTQGLIEVLLGDRPPDFEARDGHQLLGSETVIPLEFHHAKRKGILGRQRRRKH